MRTSRHLEQVLAHAASRLAATGTRRPTEVLPLYKKFLKVEEHRLRLKHQAGGGGREICARRAELVDVLLEYVYKQPNFGNTNRFKPINVGFGISYALPIVTSLLSAKPGELIIIENPESHIHPRGQAELGKLIALVGMNDVQIIVETHSDHILNGIRVAVKENPELRKNVILFYFDKIVSDTEQYSKIQEIEIDKNGELSDYPENLLDEWSNQLVKLV